MDQELFDQARNISSKIFLLSGEQICLDMDEACEHALFAPFQEDLSQPSLGLENLDLSTS